MTAYPRYAIYYAPQPDSDLDRFGAHLLGYDAFSGSEPPFPHGIEQMASDWSDLTEDPRKYGFHATLKAPFSLANGKTASELVAACETFANIPRPIPVIKPVVDSISGFIAVVPADTSAELGRLAADCVSVFDCFRAPLTPDDRARRNPAGLTPTQRNHLDRWGYPYVMEDFRFHMTLTGRLSAERRETILAMLQQRFDALKITTLTIDGIALFRQNEPDSRFRIMRHYVLERGCD
jgi:putative phosphonate metabolism protein